MAKKVQMLITGTLVLKDLNHMQGSLKNRKVVAGVCESSDYLETETLALLSSFGLSCTKQVGTLNPSVGPRHWWRALLYGFLYIKTVNYWPTFAEENYLCLPI